MGILDSHEVGGALLSGTACVTNGYLTSALGMVSSTHRVVTQSGGSLEFRPQVMFYPAVSGGLTGL